jgi:mannose-6-phosphate isomerase-like protein (cupin superfamily)
VLSALPQTQDGIILFEVRSGRLRIRVLSSGNSPQSVIADEFELEPGQCMDVPIGLIHQKEAIEDAELYEFSTQHFDSDSHRLVPGD